MFHRYLCIDVQHVNLLTSKGSPHAECACAECRAVVAVHLATLLHTAHTRLPTCRTKCMRASRCAQSAQGKRHQPIQPPAKPSAALHRFAEEP